MFCSLINREVSVLQTPHFHSEVNQINMSRNRLSGQSTRAQLKVGTTQITTIRAHATVSSEFNVV